MFLCVSDTDLESNRFCVSVCCRCIKFLRLYTNKGQKVAVGKLDLGSEGQARNVTKNRDNGMLVAVKGWQDPPKKHGAWHAQSLADPRLLTD